MSLAIFPGFKSIFYIDKLRFSHFLICKFGYLLSPFAVQTLRFFLFYAHWTQHQRLKLESIRLIGKIAFLIGLADFIFDPYFEFTVNGH